MELTDESYVAKLVELKEDSEDKDSEASENEDPEANESDLAKEEEE